MKLTPISNVGKIKEPYCVTWGSSRIRSTASVTTPRAPSDPSTICCTSGPIESRGTSQARSIVPTPVTIFTRTSMSSMLPYTLRFIPDALVAIQPPREENSSESGSCPIVSPKASRRRFTSCPIMPASIQTSMFSLSTHLILFMRCMSRLTIILRSFAGHSSAPDTDVPPPKGMMTTSCSLASRTITSTSSWLLGQMTQSGTRWNWPKRTL
mmetsp:Transcript_22647/g.55898  ORF Transcript_22647/g.55898 Transcript_22647/m.55898 type:complete len:211 (-) Transcript_22647:63-695(-)